MLHLLINLQGRTRVTEHSMRIIALWLIIANIVVNAERSEVINEFDINKNLNQLQGTST